MDGAAGNGHGVLDVPALWKEPSGPTWKSQIDVDILLLVERGNMGGRSGPLASVRVINRARIGNKRSDYFRDRVVAARQTAWSIMTRKNVIFRWKFLCYESALYQKISQLLLVASDKRRL